MSDSENTELISDFTHLHLWNMSSREGDFPGFHMPGHAGARFFSQRYRNDLISIDTTELTSSDDLHDPKGPALFAMQDSSRIYGSGATLFVTTGSTTGIHIMLASVATPDTFLLIPRTVHMSVLFALSLLDCPYAFISSPEPAFDRSRGLFPQITQQQLLCALSEYPQATDVLLVSPDYYGQCADLEELSKIAHSHGCRLLVDEAHGSHFAFADGFAPKDSMRSHVDMCVQSLHKTLPALTMASQIHISKEAVDSGRIIVRRVWDMLRIFETSSPSFVIAASSEYAVTWMNKYGRQALHDRWEELQLFLLKISDIPGVCPVLSETGDLRDPMRLVIQTDPSLLFAPDLMKLLEEKGIFIEFSDLTRLVMIVSPWNCKDDFDILFTAVRDAVFLVKMTGAGTFPDVKEFDERWGRLLTRIPRRSVSLRAALWGGMPRKEIDLFQAAGEICASIITPYPPGIPLLWPGEMITQEHIEVLSRLCEFGIAVRGLTKDRIDILR